MFIGGEKEQVTSEMMYLQSKVELSHSKQRKLIVLYLLKNHVFKWNQKG